KTASGPRLYRDIGQGMSPRRLAIRSSATHLPGRTGKRRRASVDPPLHLDLPRLLRVEPKRLLEILAAEESRQARYRGVPGVLEGRGGRFRVGAGKLEVGSEGGHARADFARAAGRASAGEPEVSNG